MRKIREDIREDEEMSLLSLPPEKPGYKFGFIRVLLRGKDDVNNISEMRRIGWETVQADDLPKDYADYAPRLMEGRYEGSIGVGDLMLMQIPEDRLRRYTARHEKLGQDREQAINAQLGKLHDPRYAPITNDSASQVTTGTRQAKFK
jgi:hypothetical protein